MLDASPTVPSAHVVGLVQPSRRQFVATLVDLPMNDESACLVVPMDIRVPKIRIKTNGWKRFVGKRLLVHIDNWEIGSYYPAGHCVEILGDVANLETEIQCLLHENQLKLEPFSPAALACLPPEEHKWKIPDKEIKKRLDLRSSHRIFSVDPPGCQDIDDTMHAKILPNGDIEIGVHIADVTYFVPHGTPLDKEAQVRGTTFYLVDRRFDMLPSLLSSDLCSLHGGMDRLAVSTIWVFSKDMQEVKSFWYGRTVIHNCQAMTYNQAHNILHEKEPDDESAGQVPPLTAGYPVNRDEVKHLKNDLAVLTRLARKLRKEREDVGGAVDLSSGDQSNELKFTLDANNNPTKVTPKKQLEIHSTIAELMILANTWVAKTIHDKMPDRALLRVHQTAEESRFEDLKEVMKAGKISFDGKSNMALADSLRKAEQATQSGSLMSFFQSLATRAMSEAQYVSTGAANGDAALSHYGLGLQRYTHFTSPIRRYADVVVHKQLLLEGETKVTQNNGRTSRKQSATSMVPSSKVISILSGEGLEGVPNPQTNTEMHGVREDSNKVETSIEQSANQKPELYEAGDVARICETLNTQNRMAKHSAFACQTLFLSLYFKDHRENTKAVVTNLRTNGFWVYIPKFDFRGPVYLSDKHGHVQLDPKLLNLSPSDGESPSTAFASSRVARMFQTGKCQLHESPDERLDVIVPMSRSVLSIRVLDVVNVVILSDHWDTRSRVPAPRIHLVAGENVESQGKVVVPPPQRLGDHPKEMTRPPANPIEIATIYQLGIELQTPPVLHDIPLRSKDCNVTIEGKQSAMIPGRLTYRNFRNPDTHSAIQEAAIAEASEAARERRNQLVAAQERKNEFNTSRQIERDATARMQRLAANKRNARRAKGK